MIITEDVARRLCWSKDQEFVIGEHQTELLGEIVIVGRRFVSGTAGTKESRSSVDAGGSDIAVIFTRERIAGPGSLIGHHNRGGRKQKGDGDTDGLHNDE